ncbi:MAG TPA: LysM domain-containing protein [Egibacteraceae bacterium]|nr:LysM domain-containing protein [Egibacteraceae bacterium]
MSGDYEYSYEDDYGARILWGRVAFFAIALALAFLLGTCVGGGDDELASQLDAEKQRVIALTSEMEQLRSDGGTTEEADSNSDAENPTPPPTTPPATEPASTEGATPPADTANIYVVKRNDTLFGIAAEVYGDGTQWRRIADANNLTTENNIREGQELTIPPKDG